MENLVTAIVWFGNTVVICIAAIVLYCMINKEVRKIFVVMDIYKVVTKCYN